MKVEEFVGLVFTWTLVGTLTGAVMFGLLSDYVFAEDKCEGAFENKDLDICVYPEEEVPDNVTCESVDPRVGEYLQYCSDGKYYVD